MKTTTALAFAIASLLAQPASSNSGQIRHYSQRALLKNWALSRCLAKAYASDEAKDDANKSAAAYLEFGKAPIENYAAIDTLVDAQLAQTYDGSVKGPYNTLKCIDLYNGPALDKLVRGLKGAK